MQGALLPSRVYQEIDCVKRNFLWGSIPEKQKMHLVNWDTVILPKDHGGLGIHETKPQNLTLIAKLNWRLLSKNSSPWAQVLKASITLIMVRNRNPWTSKGSCSRTWAACKAAKPFLDCGLRKVITTGANTSLWYDNWSFNGTLGPN